MKKGRFHRRADYRGLETARGGTQSSRTGQGDRRQRSDDLHVEVEVRRHGRERCAAAQRAGGRESPAEASGRRSQPGQRSPEVGNSKKYMVRHRIATEKFDEEGLRKCIRPVWWAKSPGHDEYARAFGLITATVLDGRVFLSGCGRAVEPFCHLPFVARPGRIRKLASADLRFRAGFRRRSRASTASSSKSL